MVESFLRPGKQDAPPSTSGGPRAEGDAPIGGKCAADLEWGVSITDACVGWEETVEMMRGLNEVGCLLFLFAIYLLSVILWAGTDFFAFTLQAVALRRKFLAQRANGVNGFSVVNGAPNNA